MPHSEVRRAHVGDVEIAYECFGRAGDPPLLLVMGLATQMIGWPDAFCEGLAGRGLFVVRFDNRDVGLSTHLHDAGTPQLGPLLAGGRSSVAYSPVAYSSVAYSPVAYSLSDMAEDAVGLLDALGLDHVHVVGASMGGMIAQAMAIKHPERIRSLTSIMSTTGDRAVGAPRPDAMAALLAPAAADRDTTIRRTIDTYRVIGSPGFAFDEDDVRARAGVSFDRAHDPEGAARQLAAILSAPDRTSDLAAAAVPTLVVHGADDPLVDVSGGRATAAAVPGAELLVIEGMGHDLPREVWPRLTDRIAGLVERTERAG